MKKKSIELLNNAVANEFSAMHQYLYFHFHCNDQGILKIAALFKKAAGDEMDHVEKLANRIIFLKGDVNMEPVRSVQKIKSVKEMLQLARSMEDESANEYIVSAYKCSLHEDVPSKKLFETLIAEKGKHFNEFDLHIENIGKYGDNYLALQEVNRTSSISSMN